MGNALWNSQCFHPAFPVLQLPSLGSKVSVYMQSFTVLIKAMAS